MGQQRKAHYLIGTPSGREVDNDVTVEGVTTASTGNGLLRADYRFDSGGAQRNIYGTIADNAHINLYIYPYPGDTTTKHLETTISAGSSSFSSATGTFSDVLNGQFWAIEAQKVCVSGSATMIAYL